MPINVTALNRFGVPTPGNQVVPQTGLIGSELALGGGLQGALGSINQAQLQQQQFLAPAAQNIQNLSQQGRNLLGNVGGRVAQSTQAGQGFLQDALSRGERVFGTGNQLLGTQRNLAQGATGQATGFLSDALGQVGQGGAQAQQFLQQGQQAGLQAIQDPINQAVSQFSPFTSAGTSASDLQAARSGALGPEAQAQAFQAFQESPGQEFLRQRGEQGVLRNAAALGGIGGGNVQKELAAFSQGLALQDLARQDEQLGQIGARGLQSAGQVGQLRGQQAGLGSSLINALSQARAGAAQTTAGQGLQAQQSRAQTLLQGQGLQSDIARSQAQNLAQGATLGADIAQSQAANLLQGRGLESSLAQSAASNLLQGGQLGSQLALAQAGVAGTAGTQEAEALLNISRDISSGRTTAGRDLATAISDTTSALSDLAETEAGQLAGIDKNVSDQISNLLQRSGLTEAEQLQSLAAILANISTGQASTVAGLPGVPGVNQTSGVLGGIGQLAGGIGGLLAGLG